MTIHSTIGMSPFKYLLGQEPSLAWDNLILDSTESVPNDLQVDTTFTVDQRVLLQNHGKLRPAWIGPYRITSMTESTVELTDGKHLYRAHKNP